MKHAWYANCLGVYPADYEKYPARPKVTNGVVVYLIKQ